MAYDAFPLRLEDHREALATLWRENMSDPRIAGVIADRMRWLYEKKPGGPALTWLGVVSGTEDVVGCGSLLRRNVVVGGRVIPGGLLADFAVTKKHRIAGAALTIQRALARGSRREGVAVLFAYPNAKSVAVFRRLGYELVGESQRWVKPLCIGVTFVDSALAFADAALSRLPRGRRRQYIETDRADARFDELWERARANDGAGIVGEKSAEYLNWRYADFTSQRHRFACVTNRETGALEAWVVYAVREGGVATIEDLFCKDLGDGRRLLLELARRLRAGGVSSLACTYLGPRSFARALRSVGFVRRPGGRSMLALVTGDVSAETRAAIFDANAWLMIDGELDI